MTDVAIKAGVSQRTVSNVVNNFQHVRPETREKVQKAIRELGFVPNVAAQKLRSGATGIIALALPNISWPYFAELAHLIHSFVVANNRTLLVAETEGNAEFERNTLEGFRSQVIDGLILSPIELSSKELKAMKLGIPVVLLGERISDVDHLHLSIDNVGAAKEVVAHLYKQGARTFLIVGAMETVATSSAGVLRFAGFTSAFDDFGVGRGSWNLVPVSPWTTDGAFEATCEYLQHHRKPDAIIAMNDLLALGVLRACYEQGLSVPDDVLLTGWDDIEASKMSVPQLTTVSPDKITIAREAVMGLIAQMEGSNLEQTEVRVQHSLKIRESSVLTHCTRC